ncbi:MAG TPA: hypothetical protein VK797_09990, partial [Tepidisphaeraceae bacterium]|nr:hypothetical protein [Tepidisphaeraceae bacterium]
MKPKPTRNASRSNSTNQSKLSKREKSKPKLVEAIEGRCLLSAVPTPAHVVIVVEENSSYDEIIGNSSAPYINTLASQGALFTNSSAIEHPSQPNYLDLFSGSNQGVTDDNATATF